jgi:hypothetical protein
MSIVDSASANGLLSTPLVLPAPLAGALAALVLVMVLMLVRRSDAIVPRLLILVSAIAVCILVTTAIFDRLEMSDRTREQRALLQREAQLSVSAITSGSLACLDGVAGEQVENSCEQSVFADAQSTARAVAYVSARLSLLADVAATARGDRDFLAAFAAVRRAIELDRYGIAAHVLSVRDGCTAERCAALAMFEDSAALKANLKVRAFETYVTRYASAWEKPGAAADKEPQTSSVTPAPVATAAEPPSVAHPLDPKYDFPSSASIPAVSIMNAEPPPPKEQKEQTGTATAHPTGEKPAASAPVPLKRPQAQAATPPQPPAPR